MHDGSENTLKGVVAFYNQGGHKNPWLSQEIQPLSLTAREQTDLVTFLQALTGEIAQMSIAHRNCRNGSRL